MPANPIALDQVLDHVLDCMCSALTATYELMNGDTSLGQPQPGCPCKTCKVPGRSQADWSSCDDPEDLDAPCFGGQLTVNVIRLYPSSDFPRQDTSGDACAPTTIVAELSVLLLRCMPTESDVEDGCLPTCTQLALAARYQAVDMLTVFRAAKCCVPTYTPPLGPSRKLRTAFLSHNAVGDAACVGSDLRLAVDLADPCGCDELLPTPDPSL